MPETFTIASLVPPVVAVAEIVGALGTGSLLPEEETELGTVSEKRRQDFTAGRECARRALQRLGIEPVPILRGPDREPLWPEGICGSLTHCQDYCAAVVARRTDLRCIGIDAERRDRLPDGVLKMVALDIERDWIEAAEPGVPWDVLLFSAKESVFKAWFPIVGTWLDFRQARIEFQPATRGFRASVLPDAPGFDFAEAPRVLTGRYHFDGDGVFTSAVIAASPRRSPPSASE